MGRQAMESDYLHKYYLFERKHWWFRVREKILMQQLDKSLPSGASLKILNAGAATGRTSQMLQKYGAVVSVEKDHDTCVFLQQKLGLDVVESELESLPFEDNLFDVVCIFDVIEHIEEQKVAISELYRVCKTGGLLYCSVPAFSFLWSRHDEVNHHVRRYTRPGITQLIQSKFKVVYNSYFNCLLFVPILCCRLFQRYMPKPKRMVSDFEHSKLLNGSFFSFFFNAIFSIEIFLLKFVPLPFGVSILVRAKKEVPTVSKQ